VRDPLRGPVRTRIKVCCIASFEEARVAIRLGADALGLVSAMPSGPGPIPEERIAEIAGWVPPPVSTFLLTCLTEPDAIIDQQGRLRCGAVQLVDALAPGAYRILREALPGVRLVQVIHMAGRESVGEALAVAPAVHALLLDSGNPALAVKELGGSGRVHDWELSREIVERSPVPVFLAGGLNPGNAAEAISRVRPFGLDVCSGLRTDGRLDEGKLAAFIAAVRGADTELASKS
jgi:phosphoribosylanthranilate isomerase